MALAEGALKGGEGLRKVPVLPQQLLEQLLPGVKGALHNQSMQGAKYFVLNSKLGAEEEVLPGFWKASSLFPDALLVNSRAA